LRIFNEYGPTEAVVGCMIHAFDPECDQGASVPIGLPADGVDIFVLDKGGNPCPTGVIGEIHVGGGRLASGYLGRADLTQSAFQPNPFGTGRLYKTGDLARISETGVITYLGRKDDQVKVGGVRVELAEVAAVIEQQNGVTQAHVIALETSAETVMDTTLVAYVAGAADGQALRSHLRGALPLAMVPSEIIAVEALPLTANGKVDTKALPAPTGGSPLQTAEAAPPETPQEMALVAIFESILDARPIGVTDNFYDMGGDSIAAIQIAIRAEEQGLSLAPNAIFEHQTIRELAATLAHAAEASAPTEEEEDTALLDLGDDDLAALAAQMERLS
ncbi:MAG: non-ribosomal peptide synthetase, partial [Pseudomonadota bacterium]